MIIFSQTDKTKVLLNFGDKPSQTDLETYMSSEDFTWDKLKGDRTRTGLALHKANRDIFTKSSPANARPNIADVVMIITDGEPRGPKGVKNETLFAYDEARALGDKDVLIIGIAMGSQKDKFKHVIQNITGSKENTFDTEFDELDTILDKLVDASCKPFKPGDCTCADIGATDMFVPPGQTTKLVAWIEPKLECKDSETQDLPLIISPYVKSPHSFAIGYHQIMYSYKFDNFYANCTVEFNISIIPCQGRDYDSNQQVCCCGKLWSKKPGWKCCGKKLYDASQLKCCPLFYNIVSNSQSCPGDDITA